MVVEEVDVAAWQAIDLGKRSVDRLRIEMSALLKKRSDITKVTLMRTSTRNND